MPKPIIIFGLVIIINLLNSSAMANVIVKGIDEPLKQNVLLLLSLNQQSCHAKTWQIQSLFTQAETEIQTALKALGYYQPQIHASLQFLPECWLAEFDIQAGKPVIIKKINIVIQGAAKNDTEFEQLVIKFKTKIGEPLQHSLYEAIKNKLTVLAQEQGYLSAKFIHHQLIIDKQNNSAEIRLTFDSGLRYHFGTVNIQQSLLDPTLIEKYTHELKQSHFYNSRDLVNLYDAFIKSGYFDNIEIRPHLQQPLPNRVPLTIQLTPKPRHQISLGLGYATDIGALFSIYYQNHRLNAIGDFLNANIDISPVLSTLETEYNHPLETGVNDFLTFGIGMRYENTDHFQAKSATLSTRLKYALANAWKQTVYIDLNYEDFYTPMNHTQSWLLVPGINWLYSVSNNQLHPTEGQRIKIDINGSYQNPLSAVSFARLNWELIWLHSLPWKGLLMFRNSIGLMAVDNWQQLPTSYRFYAGGINSIRGYDYKELAPKDVNNQVQGGHGLAVFSIEYEQPLTENWSIATFVDSGNAFNWGNLPIKSGVGVGIRWYSPIGPLRIDVALPLNEAQSDYQIYFAAGARL